MFGFLLGIYVGGFIVEATLSLGIGVSRTDSIVAGAKWPLSVVQAIFILFK